MAEEKKTHEGHRQRMRKRVEQQGFDSLEPHEALEYLLYITNARKDTNQLAHDLMGRFGDFAGVLEATEEDLLTVEGVGPATARMLHLLPAVSRYYTPMPHQREDLLQDHGAAGGLSSPVICRSGAGAGTAAGAGRPQPHQGDPLAQGRTRPGQPCHQGRGGRGAEGAARTAWCSATTIPTAWPCPRGRTFRPPRTSCGRWGWSGCICGDHIILTESEYFSMRDENRLPFYDFATGEMLRPY